MGTSHGSRASDRPRPVKARATGSASVGAQSGMPCAGGCVVIDGFPLQVSKFEAGRQPKGDAGGGAGGPHSAPKVMASLAYYADFKPRVCRAGGRDNWRPNGDAKQIFFGGIKI